MSDKEKLDKCIATLESIAKQEVHYYFYKDVFNYVREQARDILAEIKES